MKHLARALGYLKHYWLLAAGAFLGLLISTASRLVIPRLTQTIVDDGIAAGPMRVVLGGAVGTVGLAIAGRETVEAGSPPPRLPARSKKG